ncbi:MAG TPA: DUF3280 domain-containing protein [Rhodopila sp.]|nr:DUF3280 domain-containing protein [Rhodopila sp.]
MKIWPSVAIVGAMFVPHMAPAQTPVPTAVFGFELDDTSLQAPLPAEKARLKMLDTQLLHILAKSGCCKVIPATADQASQADLWNCNGCDVDLARKLDARISVVGWVQKVSNLILNINVAARSVATGKVIEEGSVDIRGNTDESWSRGLSYLMRNRLHPSDWK